MFTKSSRTNFKREAKIKIQEFILPNNTMKATMKAKIGKI